MHFHFIWLQALELLSVFLCKLGLAHCDTNWLDSLLSTPPPFELSLPGPLPTSNKSKKPARTAHNITTTPEDAVSFIKIRAWIQLVHN